MDGNPAPAPAAPDTSLPSLPSIFNNPHLHYTLETTFQAPRAVSGTDTRKGAAPMRALKMMITKGLSNHMACKF